MGSIKSANVTSLRMLRQHYINCTICACHIMKLFIPGIFYNSTYCHASASIAVTHAVMCSMLKQYQTVELPKLRTHYTN